MSLKARLAQAPAVVAPGVFDALSALLVQQAGFEAAYLSGASIAYTQLGRPDIGLVSFDHVVDVASRICERTSVPLIVDSDTGFGNALNVQRAVRLFERAGVAAIQIEDQTFPKRCGHLAGKAVVSTAEMVGKVKAAVDARRSDAVLIVARTDAIAVEGFEAALDRAEAYYEAGADVLFIEAPQNMEQMKALNARFSTKVPLLANMVEGGSTPILKTDELTEIGYRLVINPGAAVRALIPQLQALYKTIYETGSTKAFTGPMTDLKGVNSVIGLNALMAEGQKFDPEIKAAS